MTEAPESANTFETLNDLEAINNLYRERGWSDGLPIVPPTIERVDRMLQQTSRGRDEVVARLAPGFGAATVERIAINAILAGCDPAAMPVLMAATEAVADPCFNLQGIQTTTNPVAVWLVLNGPLAVQLGVNATFNCIGQGTWANATMGRALRLILQNIGGALPGEMDRATHGQPAKFTFCCAENEAENPWQPLHVERGFTPEQSTVTVVGTEGTMNMNTHAKEAPELARVIAETMVHPPSNEYVHGGEPWLLLSPEHAAVFKRGGLSKAALKRDLWERSKMSAGRLSAKELERAHASRSEELGELTATTLLPISPQPEGIQIVVAGGPGTHSVYIPCFGNSRAVSREIVTS
jgi:hypothetical protein